MVLIQVFFQPLLKSFVLKTGCCPGHTFTYICAAIEEIDMTANYSEDTIRTLDWKEHIRKRPGMYIGKLGDGSSPDDGIYILLKEVMDNCIDEYTMGFGKTIEVGID